MALSDFKYARQPAWGAGDLPVTNTDTGAIAAGDIVTLDTSHLMSTTSPTVGVKQAAADAQPLGVAIDAIPAGAQGRIATLGVIKVVASGAITAGAIVQADNSGKVKTTAGAKPQVGVALWTTTTDGDPLLVWLQLGAKNA